MNAREQRILTWLATYSETPWTDAHSAMARQVIDAFADVRLEDGIGLFEADCVDDYLAADSDEYQRWRAQDERHHWEKVLFLMENRIKGKSFAQIARFHTFSGFTFMDGKGRRFALPYYLLWALQGSRFQDIAYSLASDYVTADLPLNAQQRQVMLDVAQFLHDEAHESEADAWQKVLTHWQYA